MTTENIVKRLRYMCPPRDLPPEAFYAPHAAAGEIERMRKAIRAVTPWLSASLSDPVSGPPCQEYIDACDALFALEGEWDD